MKSVLIVENSKSVAESISTLLHRELELHCDVAHSLAEAHEKVTASNEGYIAGIFGMHLKDGDGIEIVEFALARSVPPIVFTGTLQPAMRKRLWAREVVDYVVKDSPDSLHHIVNILRRLIRNPETSIVVLDPRPNLLEFVSEHLERHLFQVVCAKTAAEAEHLMENTPNVKLLLLGDTISDMNPLAFIDKCRRNHAKEELSIITLCRQEDTEIAVNALKRGADDFLAWPFSMEEFYSRINNALDTLELFIHLRTITRTDFLTGVYNRGYLLSLMDTEHKRSMRREHPLSIIMIDADNFKDVNDTYGHSVGDLVLIRLADVVQNMIREEDNFGRFGGEEFVLALPETGHDEAIMTAERIRQAIENTVVTGDDQEIRFTISLGVTTLFSSRECVSLAALLNEADEALYAAKETGRNKVVHYTEMSSTDDMQRDTS